MALELKDEELARRSLGMLTRVEARRVFHAKGAHVQGLEEGRS